MCRTIWVILAITFLLTGCMVGPRPISSEERQSMLVAEKLLMYSDQEPLDGPVGLEEAMARTVKYNLDHRLKLMEAALANRQLDLSRFDLLPNLTASAGYKNRNNINASSSESIISGDQSLEPSTSQDKERKTAELELTWNLLDFGVSYFQARQDADRMLIAQERKRKALQNLMKEVRQVYWQAAAAQELEPQIIELQQQAEQALQQSRQIESERLQAPLKSARYQRSLLDVLSQLETIRGGLQSAKPKLAALMNLQPGTPYSIAIPEQLIPPKLSFSLPEMETFALIHRPELLETAYKQRISVDETRKSIARIFPGIELKAGGYYDANSHLVNSTWLEGGTRLTWNLMKLLSAPTSLKASKAREDVTRLNQLTLNMAVISQVHIAYHDFMMRQAVFNQTKILSETDQRIYSLTEKGQQSRSINKLETIRTAMNALISRLHEYKTFAGLQGSYGQIQASLGMDPLPAEVSSHEIDVLVGAISVQQAAWEQLLLSTQAEAEKNIPISEPQAMTGTEKIDPPQPAIYPVVPPPAEEFEENAPVVIMSVENGKPDFTVMAGPFINGLELQRAVNQLKRLGLTTEKRPGRGQISMVRLLEGEYSEDEARSRLMALKKIVTSAFILPSGGKLAVYAGSFHQKLRALKMQEKLADLKVNVSLVDSEMTLDGTMLVALKGDQKTANETAQLISSLGMYTQVIPDQ